MPLEEAYEVLHTTSLGHDIDYLHTVREKKRCLEEELKQVNAHKDDLEAKLIARMNSQGLSQAKGAKATISVRKQIRPRMLDYEEFCAFVHKHKAYQLFERRVSAAAWNELCEKRKGKSVPGTEPYVEDTISLRTIS